MSAGDTPSPPPRKWFREPWVWFVIALPASAVIGALITIWIALATDDGLVEDKYHKRGLGVYRDAQEQRPPSN